MDARLRFACALAAAGVAGLVAAGAADAAAVLRVDPADGSWTKDTPRSVRLWFDDASAAQAAQVRVTTPRHAGTRTVRTTVNDEVVTVPLPDDGDGTYRIVWFVVDDGSGQAAAGTTSFRVGTEVSDAADGSGSFTIPDAPTTTRPASSGAGSGTATTSTAPAARATTRRSTPARTPSGARSTGRTAAGSTRSSSATAVAAPRPPAAAGPTAEPFDASTLVPSGPLLAAGLAAGLLAFVAGTRWSLRRGEAAGLR